MNCKICGSSTTQKQTPRGLAYECNEDNGECRNERGYPTTSWAQTLPPRSGNGGAARVAATAGVPFPRLVTPKRTGSTSTDEQIKWQTCLKAAAQIYTGAGIPEAGKLVIALARELYAAKPVVVKPAPKPAPVEEEAPVGDEEEVF